MMPITKKKVLLCTGALNETNNTENQYKKSLLESGFECEILQVLHFEFINQDELQKHLLDAESYSGLILTSPRAAAAIAMLKIQNPICIEPWLKLPTFCIGQATELITKEQIGLSYILGSDSGNAKNLGNFIINTWKKNCKKPLLLPCSNIAKDTILKMLSEENISVKKIVIYKTKVHDSLKKSVHEALIQLPQVLVFFSPSIVENIIIAISNEISILQTYKIVAIGPVTEQALLNFNITVHGVAEKPEPKALTKIINKLFID
ncbi:PREDICTED: uroporphyrinogen-III synthase-like [Ceratosolen solmsi marchali]|uniref:Uroporphyrinogen-III synthase n=1 Tax=Ceratosolen solmsi marchali TaxID=326594 RepID=A0AAJ6YR52_9HYME|nr:PREDICTED: uroporphyrinogen-III synthase-like [Ceratosolen solmsi marchali]